MNPSFNIQTTRIDTASAQLFLKAGPTGISFFILDAVNYFSTIVVYSFPNGMNAPAFTKEVLQKEALLQQQYKKTHIFWSFPESILVPPELMQPENNNEMLNLVYGDANRGAVKTDFLYKHNLHHVYRLPADIHDRVSMQFPFANQTHEYSLLADRKVQDENEMFVVFYTSNFTVMLRKAGKLQVIQNFAYRKAEDAAYHLLDVCKNFEVDPRNVILHISGMIDDRSNLYTGIYKYFLTIKFEDLPDKFQYLQEIKDHPPHFFSHLFALAACV